MTARDTTVQRQSGSPVRRWSHAAILTAALAAFATPAWAQLGVSSGGSGSAGASAEPCVHGDGASLGLNSAGAFTCGTAGDVVTSSAAWQVASGVIGGSASLNFANALVEDRYWLYSHGGEARFQASWLDNVTVISSHGTPAFLDLYLRLTGTVSGSFQAPEGNCSELRMELNAYLGGTSAATHASSPFDRIHGSAGCPDGPIANPVGTASWIANENMYLRSNLVPAGSNSAVTSVQWQLDGFLSMSYDPYNQNYGQIVNGGGTIDFSHTLSPIGIAVFDIDGNDITTGSVVTFESGIAIPLIGVTAAPEPATWALLAAGLVGVAAVSRRRRAA